MRNALTPFLPTLFLLALPLSACTGSEQEINPVLLVTGFQRGSGDTATNHVGLIRDTVIGDASSRLEFFPGSVQDLPAPAVSYDITNRENARNTLVVLSRGTSVAGTATPSFLSFFNLSQINADTPTAFARSRPTDITINTLPIVPDNFPSNPLFCPSEVQLSQGGLYAAVLNVPRLCNVTAQNFIDILALEGTPRLLGRIGNVASGESAFAGGGIYVAQGSDEDTLYYATQSPASLTLSALTLPRPGDTFAADYRLPPSRTVVAVQRNARTGSLVDLGVSGQSGSDQLAVLSTQGLAYVSGYTSEGTVSGPVVTLENDNARLIRDDLRRTDTTLVLGTPEASGANRFSLFPASFTSDDDNDPVSNEVRTTVNATDAVIEPNNGYVYFVANGRVSLFDLQSYDTGEDLETVELGVPELTRPTFVTWTQALGPTTP